MSSAVRAPVRAPAPRGASYASQSQPRRRASVRPRGTVGTSSSFFSAAADDANDFTLGCPHFDACPGCSMEVDLDSPSTLERARAFFAERGVRDFRGRTGATRGWRNRARLAVRSVPDDSGREKVALGLFARGTHDLVQIPDCVAHHPRLNAAAAVIVEACDRSGIRAYDEAGGTGDLRYVQLTAVGAGGTSADLDPSAAVQVALVWNAPAPLTSPPSARVEKSEELPIPERAEALAREIWRAGGGAAGGSDEQEDEGGGLIHSVWVNFNDSRKNDIVGEVWAHVAGPRWHWSRHGGADVCYTPGSFMQSNSGAYNELLRALSVHVPSGAAVSELYAGAGAIGLSIAAGASVGSGTESLGEGEGGGVQTQADGTVGPDQSPVATTSRDSVGEDRIAALSSVRCVECVAAARETFEVSAGRLPEAMRQRVSFEVARADQAVNSAVRDADVLIVDPPRKGLDAYTLAALTGGVARIGHGGGEGGAAVKAGSRRRNRRRRAKRKDGGGGDAEGEPSLVPTSSTVTLPPPPDRLDILIYVSCGFDSFVRDCDALLGSGEWRIAHAEGFNFFPGGDALEVLAVFHRNKTGGVGNV